MVCGPIRRKYGVNPFHRAKTPSFLINFTKQSKAPEYSPPLHVIPKECDPLHHLQARLDDIDGERHKTAEQTGGEGRSDVQSQSVRLEEMPLLIVQLLRLRVPSQLRRVQHHGAHHRRRGSLPQRLHALLLADAVDGLEAVRVASALLGRKAIVSGGADQRHFGRVAHDGTAGTADHTANQLLRKGNVVSVVSLPAVVHTVREDAETRRGVGNLTKHARSVATDDTQQRPAPSVQLEEALRLRDFDERVQTALVLLLGSTLTTIGLDGCKGKTSAACAFSRDPWAERTSSPALQPFRPIHSLPAVHPSPYHNTHFGKVLVSTIVEIKRRMRMRILIPFIPKDRRTTCNTSPTHRLCSLQMRCFWRSLVSKCVYKCKRWRQHCVAGGKGMGWERGRKRDNKL